MSDIFTVDARGLACPQPVLLTKKVLDEGVRRSFIVLVDNEAARENVSRLARGRGCEVSLKEQGAGVTAITVDSAGSSTPPKQDDTEYVACAAPQPEAQTARNVVYIATACMGTGDDVLGAKLMRGFLRTLIDVAPTPWRMIFINSGVKLTTVDEEAVDAISMLQDRGVEVLSCGTCLQHFGLEKDLKVGKSTNMFEVIESLNGATKVISPD